MSFSLQVPSVLRSARRVGALLLAASSLAVVPAAAHAQTRSDAVVDPRFQPWLGCWSPSTDPLLPPPDGAAAPSAMACLVPSRTIARSVDVVLFDAAGVASRSAIPLPGSPSAKRVDDCTGAETATWSADERRLVLRADLTCERGVSRVETGLLTMAPSGEWLQVQHLAVAGNAVTTVARMRFRDDAAARYAELGGGRVISTPSLRLATGAPVTAEKVLDVANKTPEALTEAWIAELGQRFALNGQQLVKLADGGMPPRVLDLMVAVSHPEAFQLRGSANSELVDERQLITDGRTNSRANNQCGTFDDFCYGPGGFGAWGLGMRRFGGWDPYMLGFGQNAWGFGGSPFNGGFGFGNGLFFGNTPVIIVNRPTGASEPEGRLVRGRGYTRERSSDISNPSPTRSGGGASSGFGGSSGSSGGSMGGGGASSGGGASTGRTAKPRGSGGN